MGECNECIKDDFKAMSGAWSVNKWLLRALVVSALGSGVFSSVIAVATTQTNSDQSTQIALNLAAITELRKIVEQNVLGIDKLRQERQDQTDEILKAIEEIKN